MKKLNSSFDKRVVADTIFMVTTLVVIILTGCNFPVPYPGPIPCGDTEELIKAIDFANSDPTTHDIIDLVSGCTYTLYESQHKALGYTGLPAISTEITINGNGATIMRKNDPALEKFRLLVVDSTGILSLNDLILVNGYADDPLNPTTGPNHAGGAARNNGNLTLTHVVIENNTANGVAGGLYNEGDLIVKASTIRENTMDGMVYLMGGAVAIHNRFGATAYIQSSTINKNVSFNNILTNDETADMTIENSTISNNTGRALNNDGDLVLLYVTIVGHTSGIWSVWYGVPTVEITGSLFQNDTDCQIGSGVLTKNFFNMDSDGTCGFAYTVPASGQLLGPLTNNGGGTMTHALLAASPAIDAVTGPASRVCPIPEDQRGVIRPQHSFCDIGAYEYDGPLQPAIVPYNKTPIVVLPTPTPKPEYAFSRCDLFDVENATISMFDIPSKTTFLQLYVEWPHPVPGYETLPDDMVISPEDDLPWEYSALIGSTGADKCSYQGYSGRIYCDFTLPRAALGAALEMYMFVNGCDDPIFFHPWVSIFDPDVTEETSPIATETPVVACTVGLSAEACKLAGGTYDPATGSCICP